MSAAKHLGSVRKFSFQQASKLRLKTSSNYVIKNLLDYGQLATCVGKPSSGKSFVIMDMFAAVTQGRAWCGRRVKRSAVMWIALEGLGSGLERRVEALFVDGRLTDEDPFYFSTVPVSLLKDVEEIVARIMDAVSESKLPPAVVVVDTLSKALSGADENASDVMTAAIRACGEIQERTGAAVVLIHHVGKEAGKGPRGHSALSGAQDVELDVSRHGDERAIVVGKSRDGDDGREFPFRLKTIQIGIDEDHEPITSCVVEYLGASSPGPSFSGKHRLAAWRTLVEWASESSTDFISGVEFKKLLKDNGCVDRQRHSELVNFLVSKSILAKCTGGFTVSRERLLGSQETQ